MAANHLPRLGFVGQGWIGRNLADHFAERGFNIVRYSLEPEHENNQVLIGECDIVFIAVPTPTTPDGFQLGAVRDALRLVGKGKTAVIKSTVLPGSTDQLAEAFPEIYVLHSPEFLREASVRQDIDEPERNIVGIPGRFLRNQVWRDRARDVLHILPKASKVVTNRKICKASEAEMVKYIGNVFLAMKVVFMNIGYDLAKAVDADWNTVAEAVALDSRISASHMNPVHQHQHMGKASARGAGGHCFPKDLAAFRQVYERLCPQDQDGRLMLTAIEKKNMQLMLDSGKDPQILQGIYGQYILYAASPEAAE